MSETVATISHEDIYERLVKVEAKVDAIEKNTKELIEAFSALKGALKVLDWIASLAKPIGIITVVVGAITVAWHSLTGK